MSKKSLQPSSLAVPAAPFVPGTRKGPFVFTSGQVAFDRSGNLVGKGDIRTQTRQVLEKNSNIKVLALSSFQDNDSVNAMLKTGASG